MHVLKPVYHIVRPLLSIIPVGSFTIGIIVSLFDPFTWSLYRDSSVLMFFILSVLSLPVFLLSYLAVFLLGISSSSLNSLVDARDCDLKGFRKDYQNPVVYCGVSPLHMKIIVIFCSVASLVIGFYISLIFAVMIFFGNLISISYSYYPRIKVRPPFDVLWNAIGLFTLPFIAGWVVYHGSPEAFAHLYLTNVILFYFLGVRNFVDVLVFILLVKTFWFPFFELFGGTLIGGAFYILTATLDYESDSETGNKTISIILGKRCSILLSFALYLFGALIMFEHLIFDLGTVVLFFLIAFFMVYLVIKPEKLYVWNFLKLTLMATLILICVEIIVRICIS
ncbi:MAG: UbiA family prenyltransferase [Candidatus Jordarchaeaceae archaeon]